MKSNVILLIYCIQLATKLFEILFLLLEKKVKIVLPSAFKIKKKIYCVTSGSKVS